MRELSGYSRQTVTRSVAVVATATRVVAHTGHRGPVVTLPYLVAGVCLLGVGVVWKWRELPRSERLPVVAVAVGVLLLLAGMSGVRSP